jgi:DNA-binding protein H-NS
VRYDINKLSANWTAEMEVLEEQIRLQRQAYDRTREEAHACTEETARHEKKLGARAVFMPRQVISVPLV